ncbi:MAG: MFS transporter [Phycisphaeraceae bacterium]|nr:MFS transporter [Phycisphaeraceae bacterium]
MSRLQRILLATFLLTLAALLIARGTYFYTEKLFAFTKSQNLWLALGMGVAYVLGAFVSHRLSIRLGQRRLLQLTILGQALIYILQTIYATPLVVSISYVAVALPVGAMWPLLESFVSAGHNPADTSRMLSRFNVSWSVAIPLAVALVGPLIKLHPSMLFVVPTVLCLAASFLLRKLEQDPVHLPLDHPDRPPPHRLDAYASLTLSARLVMMVGYGMTYILAPVVPEIFQKNLHLSLPAATTLWALYDVSRLLAFLLMRYTTAWHDRRSILALPAVLTPLSFLLILMSPGIYPNVALVILGELIFGLSQGIAYNAALYYVTVIKNASVEAGGDHEAIIGLGYVLGPSLALFSVLLAQATQMPTAGQVIGLLPLTAGSLIGGIYPLLRRPAKSSSPNS